MTTEQPGIEPSRLVFVGGLHRSGTTPLTRILGAHPKASIFRHTGVKEDEGQHLQSVYPAARAYGGAGRFAFDPRSHLTEESPLCTADNAARLLADWSSHWDLDRSTLVEKSPPNLVMTRFLAALFPGSRMVICVRHPIVVALSTAKWAGPLTRLGALVEHWLAAYSTFRDDARHLDSVHVVRYEHLVADPEATLDGLAGYLGLGTPIPADQVDARRNESYIRRWGELRASRLPWHRRTVRELEERYAAALAGFGYDVDDLTAVVDTPWAVRPEVTDG